MKTYFWCFPKTGFATANKLRYPSEELTQSLLVHQTISKLCENLKLFKLYLSLAHDLQISKSIKVNRFIFPHTKICFKTFLLILKILSAYLYENQRNTMT